MDDRERIMKGLKYCSDGCSENCPYFEVDGCDQLLAGEALELLKEQAKANALEAERLKALEEAHDEVVNLADDLLATAKEYKMLYERASHADGQKSPDQTLEETRKECLTMIQEACTMAGRLQWYYIHYGEIDFAYHHGLITHDRHRELVSEWETNQPRQTANWQE